MRGLSIILCVIVVLFTSQTPTPYINRAINTGSSIKVVWSNGSYEYIYKPNISRVVNFTNQPNSVTIETNRRGATNQDNTIRLSSNLLLEPTVANGKALSDTINAWLYDTRDINTNYLINATSCP